jgi:hypothetical protein
MVLFITARQRSTSSVFFARWPIASLPIYKLPLVGDIHYLLWLGPQPETVAEIPVSSSFANCWATTGRLK